MIKFCIDNNLLLELDIDQIYTFGNFTYVFKDYIEKLYTIRCDAGNKQIK